MKGTTGVRIRRENAKKMLEAQLKRGTKPEKINGKTTSAMIPLSTADVARINRELDVLNNVKKKTHE
jgi:hypothetical protein